MIKRPLNSRFTAAINEGRKISTIRDKPWPVGVPIMLYNWSGLPYRSKQSDVAAIIVHDTQPIMICRSETGFITVRSEHDVCLPNVWQCEGFSDKNDFDAWFRPLVKPCGWITKHLMLFRLASLKVCAGKGGGA